MASNKETAQETLDPLSPKLREGIRKERVRTREITLNSLTIFKRAAAKTGAFKIRQIAGSKDEMLMGGKPRMGYGETSRTGIPRLIRVVDVSVHVVEDGKIGISIERTSNADFKVFDASLEAVENEQAVNGKQI